VPAGVRPYGVALEVVVLAIFQAGRSHEYLDKVPAGDAERADLN
jgi:hypothetical protein